MTQSGRSIQDEKNDVSGNKKRKETKRNETKRLCAKVPKKRFKQKGENHHGKLDVNKKNKKDVKRQNKIQTQKRV